MRQLNWNILYTGPDESGADKLWARKARANRQTGFQAGVDLLAKIHWKKHAGYTGIFMLG